MDRDEKQPEYRQEYPSTASGAKIAVDRDISNIDVIMATNEELLSALEKQIEFLYGRLEPVSARYPEGDRTETEQSVRGESSLAQKLAKQTYRMRSLSDRIGRMTKELEV